MLQEKNGSYKQGSRVCWRALYSRHAANDGGCGMGKKKKGGGWSQAPSRDGGLADNRRSGHGSLPHDYSPVSYFSVTMSLSYVRDRYHVSPRDAVVLIFSRNKK